MTRQRVRKLTLIISLLLFPVTLYYFSPALIINAGLGGIVNGSFIVFAPAVHSLREAFLRVSVSGGRSAGMCVSGERKGSCSGMAEQDKICRLGRPSRAILFITELYA